MGDAKSDPDGNKAHWDKVYEGRDTNKVSWYQDDPATSLQMIEKAQISPAGSIIDVGGGASRLVDDLLARGYEHLSVLDIAAAAMEASRQRLGDRAHLVNWLVCDVLQFAPEQPVDLWHDRAVFHFLTDETERAIYLDVLHGALADGGQAVMAVFALDGPQKCSNLPVQRYDAAGLARQFGPRFKLLEQAREKHLTPAGATQHFTCCRFAKL